jgi:hypothetical protein
MHNEHRHELDKLKNSRQTDNGEHIDEDRSLVFSIAFDNRISLFAQLFVISRFDNSEALFNRCQSVLASAITRFLRIIFKIYIYIYICMYA